MGSHYLRERRDAGALRRGNRLMVLPCTRGETATRRGAHHRWFALRVGGNDLAAVQLRLEGMADDLALPQSRLLPKLAGDSALRVRMGVLAGAGRDILPSPCRHTPRLERTGVAGLIMLLLSSGVAGVDARARVLWPRVSRHLATADTPAHGSDCRATRHVEAPRTGTHAEHLATVKVVERPRPVSPA